LSHSFSIRLLPPSPLFPYTTLFRSCREVTVLVTARQVTNNFGDLDDVTARELFTVRLKATGPVRRLLCHFLAQDLKDLLELMTEDRKSTRLNSSHVSISYAVFCLKK